MTAAHVLCLRVCLSVYAPPPVHFFLCVCVAFAAAGELAVAVGDDVTPSLDAILTSVRTALTPNMYANTMREREREEDIKVDKATERARRIVGWSCLRTQAERATHTRAI
jgi:hypothetical protein